MVAQGRNCPTDVEMNLTEFTDRLKVENSCEFNEILITAAIGPI